MPADELIREVISVTRTTISDDDREIASRYTTFIRHALEFAERQLIFGPPETRLRLAETAIKASARLATLDAKAEVAEHRVAFEHLLSSVTDIPELTHIVTDKEIIDVEPAALLRPADD